MTVIDEFIQTKRSKNTKDGYLQGINDFFKTIKKKPETYFNPKHEMQVYENDFKTWVSSLMDRVAPLTQKCWVSSVKNFLLYYDVEFSTKYWRNHINGLMPRSARPLTLDDKPSNEQLKKILSYGDLKAKALFSMLATSGMRISEALQIKPEHINLKTTPAIITIPSKAVKGDRRPRRVFISEETKQLIIDWIKPNENGISERDKFIDEIEEQMKGVLKNGLQNRDKLFPIKPSATRRIWGRLLKRAELDIKSSETGRFELHIHSLRKFFLSQLKIKCPDVIVEALAGHNRYLDEAYRRYSLDEMKEHYLNGMDMLTIFETNTTDERLTEVNELLKEKEQRIKELEQKIEDINKKLDKGVATYLFNEIQKIKSKNK